MFRVIETFSGIGAQAKALERIDIEHEIINTCEWDINAMFAYCSIHKECLSIDKYQNVSDKDIDTFLKSKTLSLDGKKAITEKTFSKFTNQFKRILYSIIQETNNLVSITDVKGEDISEDVDLFTYSFPCQDLSLCGAWHGNMSGIARDAHNRSGMLWEVERILKEMYTQARKLPRFLVMENVTNILSATHKADFDDWKSTLESLGYYNKIYRLNSKNFGVPQKRERAYMISILVENDLRKIMILNRYFEENNLEEQPVAEKYRDRTFGLKDVLKTDYSVKKYKSEAEVNQPNDTPSRRKIYEENDMLYDGVSVNEIYVNTVTTKQDRNPNSGLITYDSKRPGKSKWRYLTPRECFMLMGFDEIDYEKAISENPIYANGRKLLTNEKLIKMAGNSICVDVLEAIFKQIVELKKILF